MPAYPTAVALRQACRIGDETRPTSSIAPKDALHYNMTVLARSDAIEMVKWSRSHPAAAPLRWVGTPKQAMVIWGVDVYRDLPGYCVYDVNSGVKTEPSVAPLASFGIDSPVVLLYGCSFSFEQSLEDAGVPVRHRRAGSNVAMFTTTTTLDGGGWIDKSSLVVSVRSVPKDLVEIALKVTEAMPESHGGPVAVGYSESNVLIGSNRTVSSSPDFGDVLIIEEDDIPVCWACGVSAVLAVSKAPKGAITHEPGKMLVLSGEESRICNGIATFVEMQLLDNGGLGSSRTYD